MISKLRNIIVQRVVSNHLSGSDVESAVRVHRESTGAGWSSTLGYWGFPDDTPVSHARAYVESCEVIGREHLSSYISIKLPALGFDPALVRRVLEAAAQYDIRVHFDSLGPEVAGETIERVLWCKILYTNISCSVPSRWQRSMGDINRLSAAGVRVRIVKGQWTDPSVPDIDVKKNYIALAEAAVAAGNRVAIATHDRPLARTLINSLEGYRHLLEIEQMLSLPQNCAALAGQYSIPMYIYIPYGYPSLPYTLREAPVRPAIIAWAVRDFILGSPKKLSPRP